MHRYPQAIHRCYYNIIKCCASLPTRGENRITVENVEEAPG